MRLSSGSLVMPALKESSAPLSTGMQLPLDVSLALSTEEVVGRMITKRKRKLAAAMALWLARLVCIERTPNENMARVVF
jgi:hypothetical protein